MQRRFALIKHQHVLADLTDFSVSGPSNGQVLAYNSGTGKWQNAAASVSAFVRGASFVSSSALALPINDVSVLIPVACTITAATTTANAAGSCVVDIWKDSYANYPPTGADTICASARPTLTAANRARDTTLTGWTTAIAAGDILHFNLVSVSGLKWVNVVLTLLPT